MADQRHGRVGIFDQPGGGHAGKGGMNGGQRPVHGLRVMVPQPHAQPGAGEHRSP